VPDRCMHRYFLVAMVQYLPAIAPPTELQKSFRI
jgi:hypothetical protein